MDKKTVKEQLETAGQDDEPVMVHIVTKTEDIWVDITAIEKAYVPLSTIWTKGTVFHSSPIAYWTPTYETHVHNTYTPDTRTHIENTLHLTPEQKTAVRKAILDISLEDTTRAAEEAITTAGTEHISKVTVSHSFEGQKKVYVQTQDLRQVYYDDPATDSSDHDDPSEAEMYNVPDPTE